MRCSLGVAAVAIRADATRKLGFSVDSLATACS